MKFTYTGYISLLSLLQEHRYEITSYDNWATVKRCAILRHDIDNDIRKAVELAKIEEQCGVRSTYFVLVTSDFYNVCSRKNIKKLQEIASYGHEIGLHYDEMSYPELAGDLGAIRGKILQEAGLLESVVGKRIKTVSMHRPSKEILDSDLQIPGMINSYSKIFFREFKYLSDSRRCWREPIEDIIRTEKYERLHILTHAFWYAEREKDIHDSIKEFVNSANIQRYNSVFLNITDLETIMGREEIR